MTTGKQSAVHAQQNSDGTFELHVDSGEEQYTVDEPILAPEPARKPRSWKIPILGVSVVLLVVGIVATVFWFERPERSEIADNLEPVQGFRPYTGGAGAPSVAKRPSRPATPVADSFEEEFEDETGGEIESASPVEVFDSARPVEMVESARPIEDPVVPMRPPAVLQNRVVQEVEESPVESGWDVEDIEIMENHEESYQQDPYQGDQGSLMRNIKKSGRLEQIERNAQLNSTSLPMEQIARSKRHLAIGSEVLRIGDRSRFARAFPSRETEDDSDNE